MPQVVCDSSCLIVLDKIEHLSLLKAMYDQALITAEVEKEFGRPLPDYLVVRAVQDNRCCRVLQTMLDAGEATVIALALEIENSVLILDDLKARKIARAIGIRLTGTLGVLIEAKSRDIVLSVKPLLRELRNRGFWISDDLYSEVLTLAGE